VNPFTPRHGHVESATTTNEYATPTSYAFEVAEAAAGEAPSSALLPERINIGEVDRNSATKRPKPLEATSRQLLGSSACAAAG